MPSKKTQIRKSIPSIIPILRSNLYGIAIFIFEISELNPSLIKVVCVGKYIEETLLVKKSKISFFWPHFTMMANIGSLANWPLLTATYHRYRLNSFSGLFSHVE